MRREELAFAIDLAAQRGGTRESTTRSVSSRADSSGFLIAGAPRGAGRVRLGRFLRRALRLYGSLHRTPGVSAAAASACGCGCGHGAASRAQRRTGRRRGAAGQLCPVRSALRTGTSRYRGQARRAELHASVVAAGEAAFKEIAEFDRQIFPERRDGFLRSWLAQPTAGVCRQERRPNDRLHGGPSLPGRLEDRPLGR